MHCLIWVWLCFLGRVFGVDSQEGTNTSGISKNISICLSLLIVYVCLFFVPVCFNMCWNSLLNKRKKKCQIPLNICTVRFQRWQEQYFFSGNCDFTSTRTPISTIHMELLSHHIPPIYPNNPLLYRCSPGYSHFIIHTKRC